MTISLDALAAATELLAGPTPASEKATELARALVPRAACAIIVDLIAEDGALERVAVEHRDPAMAQVTERLKNLGPPNPDSRSGVQHVLRMTKAQLIAQIDPDELARAARSAAHVEAMRASGIRSLMIVPLRALGRTVGILWLVGTAAREAYTPRDLLVATAIGNALALAADCAFYERTAEEAVRVRDEFLSVASHELRTPLTALSLQLEVLRRGNLTPAKSEEKMRNALRQVERLTRLAHVLLDLPRVSGRLELQPVRMDLSQTARDVATSLEEEARRAGCTVSVDAPSPVVGMWDLFRVEQVVTNLLSNAVKYGRGAPVTISVRAAKGRGVLAVVDEGIGVAPADHERIFERFERAAPSREYGGLGLGLFIVGRVVEAQGGTIRVESARGKGARFVVELPIATASPATGTH